MKVKDNLAKILIPNSVDPDRIYSRRDHYPVSGEKSGGSLWIPVFRSIWKRT